MPNATKNVIKRNSTTKTVEYRLDSVSWESLCSLLDTFNRLNNPQSQSVLVRRAIKHYKKHVEAIYKSGRADLIKTELEELTRAKKGV